MTSNNADRRDFLKAAAGLGLAATLPMVPGLSRAAGGSVVVGTWGGDYENLLQQIISPILKKQGVDVVFDTGNSEPRITKLRAEKNSRRGSMDVPLLSDLDMYQVSRSDVLMPIKDNARHIPNLVNVYDQFRTPYSIPHIFSAMVLVYSTKKFPTPPTSIEVMLDPKNKGGTGFSDILFAPNALFVGAGTSAPGRIKSFQPGIEFLKKLKQNAPRVYPSNEAVAAAFKSGEIWISAMWKARALQWRDAGLPVDFVMPKEGSIPVTFEAAVAKNSRNKDAAWAYLNAMLDPSGQVQFAKAMGYAPTVRNAPMSDELRKRVGFTEDELKNLRPYDLAALDAAKSDYLDFWNKSFKVGL